MQCLHSRPVCLVPNTLHATCCFASPRRLQPQIPCISSANRCLSSRSNTETTTATTTATNTTPCTATPSFSSCALLSLPLWLLATPLPSLAMDAPSSEAAYDPSAGAEFFTTIAGVGYVGVVGFLLFRLLQRRAKRATSEVCTTWCCALMMATLHLPRTSLSLTMPCTCHTHLFSPHTSSHHTHLFPSHSDWQAPAAHPTVRRMSRQAPAHQ